MAEVEKIFEQLGSMSVLELVELKKKIEDEWGITAAAPVARDSWLPRGRSPAEADR